MGAFHPQHPEGPCLRRRLCRDFVPPRRAAPRSNPPSIGIGRLTVITCVPRPLPAKQPVGDQQGQRLSQDVPAAHELAGQQVLVRQPLTPPAATGEQNRSSRLARSAAFSSPSEGCIPEAPKATATASACPSSGPSPSPTAPPSRHMRRPVVASPSTSPFRFPHPTHRSNRGGGPVLARP
jgi:hypothetical protein